MSEENKASQPLAAGSSAPDFALPARSGKTISLHDFAGQKDVLIYFYPKDDTPGCTRESCSLRDNWGDLTKAGIEVLGISRDDAASHNAFAAKYNLPFELLTDSDHAVHEAYGAWGQNPNPAWGIGPLRKSFLIGKDGKIKHVFDKVDTERHAEQVLRAAGVAAAKPLRPPARSQLRRPPGGSPPPAGSAAAAPVEAGPRPGRPRRTRRPEAPRRSAAKKTVKKASRRRRRSPEGQEGRREAKVGEPSKGREEGRPKKAAPKTRAPSEPPAGRPAKPSARCGGPPAR